MSDGYLELPAREIKGASSAMHGSIGATGLDIRLQLQHPTKPQSIPGQVNMVKPFIQAVQGPQGKVVLAGDVIFNAEGVDFVKLQEQVNATNPSEIAGVLAQIFNEKNVIGINGSPTLPEVIQNFNQAMELLGVGKEFSIAAIGGQNSGQAVQPLPVPITQDALKNVGAASKLWHEAKEITPGLQKQFNDFGWELVALQFAKPTIGTDKTTEHVI